MRGALLGVAALVKAPTRRTAGAEDADAPAAAPATKAHPGFFNEPERRALARLADHVLPGAAQAGAVEYIETFLTAFDHDPPRIHAGGPFSGRRPHASGAASEASFDDFVPLDRVQERAWRLRLYGSGPDDPLGQVTGLRPMMLEGARHALTRAESDVAGAWSATTEAFRERFTELVVEATFGDPVYGGNRAQAGWELIQFEGDSLPLGFTPWDAETAAYRIREDAPHAGFSGEPDPAPLTWSTRLWLWVLAFLSRRGVVS